MTHDIPYPLPPAVLDDIGEQLYGHRSRYKKTMATDLLVHAATVSHWANGRSAVPGPAVAALRLIAQRRKIRIKPRVSAELEELLS